MREMPKLFWLIAPLCVVFVSTQASAQSTAWDTTTSAGLEAYEQGRFGEAEEYLSAALKEAENSGPGDPHLATSLNNLAPLYRTQGKHAEAEPLYKRALAIFEKTPLRQQLEALGVPVIDDFPTASDVPRLLQELKSDNEDVRRSAAHDLQLIGPDAKEAVPALINALQDDHATVRAAAAAALQLIGPDAKEAVPALIVGLQDDNHYVREAAALALSGIGPDAKAAVPALINALQDDHHYVRAAAVGALRYIGPDAKAAVPALIDALQDEVANYRGAAATALGSIGADAEKTVPALINALQDDSAGVRRSAASSIVSIAKRLQDDRALDAIPALVEARQGLEKAGADEEAEDVRRAVEALNEIEDHL